MLISPIFYMGNKRKLIKQGLIELFPDNINTFIDLFGGSGIVSMNTNAEQYILNDIDPYLFDLYNLFSAISSQRIITHIKSRIHRFSLAEERTKRNNFEDKEKIEKYKTAYYNFRDYANTNPNVLDFYTLTFYSFSQQFRFNSDRQFNMPCGNDCFSEKNEQYIKDGCNFFRKSNVSIKNTDFRELSISQLTKQDFIYLDPPYLNTTAVYNERHSGWTEKDEFDLLHLCEELNRNEIKWGMSNVFKNKSKTNNHLIEWCKSNEFKINTFDKFDYVACGKGKSNTVEVFITNY